MKVITKKFLYISFVVNVLKSCVFGATHFSLPDGTPGLQKNFGTNTPNLAYINEIPYEHVVVPNTNCDLYFPTDGSQPNTTDAGIWSGARYNTANEKNLVTNWWVRVFGGNKAVDLSRDGFPDKLNNAPEMGFDSTGASTHIIQVDTTAPGTPANFEQQFWRTFRDIAADPVGRVLLYRLLIEIRRVDDSNAGCCGDDVNVMNFDDRNNCRSIKIFYLTDGFSFNANGLIRADFNSRNQPTVLSLSRSRIVTQKNSCTPDIAIFHEMLHWFHFLRNPNRKISNSRADPLAFKYPLRCYYGDVSELHTWGNINAEEIATILGIPNLNNQKNRALIASEAFYESPVYQQIRYFQINIRGKTQYIPESENFITGDDLSENVYRLSKSQRLEHQYMRFGHGSCINPFGSGISSFSSTRAIADRVTLAHQIASDCYSQITNQQPQNWYLIQGQAIL